MRKRKNSISQLAADAAFIAAVTLANRCLASKENTEIKRDGDEKSLNRKLTMVSLVYHAIGIFYNE
jgi:hypothetical protein